MEPVSQPFTFELCAETLDACRVARAGGAHRLELCTDLRVGGLTLGNAAELARRTGSRHFHASLRAHLGDRAPRSLQGRIEALIALLAEAIEPVLSHAGTEPR